MSEKIEQAFKPAKEKYQQIGVDVEDAIKKADEIAISLHCWQGDDVDGFENKNGLDGGIAATGNYPGKATTPQQLRADLEETISLIPGKLRLNLHAIYAETDGKCVERADLEPAHFQNWINWAKDNNLALDYNGTYFSHPKASDGLTLSHPSAQIRDYWIHHGITSRRIGAVMGKELGSATVHNTWIPDGFKDLPASRNRCRIRLEDSLDKIFKEVIDEKYLLDAVESKLFGIGSESFVVGSHEFYFGYAMKNNKLLCLDTGHFHPTESVADKMSSCLQFIKGILLHVSRPVRWDSDHVVAFSDDVRQLCLETVATGQLDRVHFGLDYFDASINRIAAWALGARNLRKSLLEAMLFPLEQLVQAEESGDLTTVLTTIEAMKVMPFGAVWDMMCLRGGVAPECQWYAKVQDYENRVLRLR